MQTVYYKSNTKPLSTIVKAAFAGYRKQRIGLAQFAPIHYDSQWSGGTRDEYCFVDLRTLQVKPVPLSIGTVENLPIGWALVTAGSFCGKAATARVYVNSADLAALTSACGSPLPPR